MGTDRTRVRGRERDVVLHVIGCRAVQYGAFEDNLVALVRACARRGLAMCLAYPAEPPVERFRQDVEAAGGRVIVVPHSDEVSVRGVWAIAKTIIRTRPVAVHAHFGRPSYVAAALGRLAGVKYVLATKHHESWPELSEGHALSLRVLSRFADEIVCVSDVVSDEVLAAGVDERRVTTIPFGVDTARFAPVSATAGLLSAELGLSPSAPLVLCVSHMRHPKGIDVLVRAWAEVHRLHPDAVLLLAGDGPLRSELEALARDSGVFESIRMLGVRHDVPRLLAECDVFVCPSLSEGGGLNILEALSAGVPTVSTPVGLVLGFSRHGLYRPSAPGDADSLTRALSAVLDDPEEARAMGLRAREYVERFYSTQRFADTMAGRYAPSAPLGEREVAA